MLRPVDDQRLGAALRALRRRRRMRQVDVAAAAGVSRSTISRLERGHVGTLTLGTLRAIFAVLDARIEITPLWRGGALDRLLDERHAELVGRLAGILQGAGWETAIEVTFSHYGERGSIDILAAHPARRALLVNEVKIDLTSIEETVRRSDAKTRLAVTIGEQRFGWRATTVARLLVLPDDATTRRRVARHAPVLGAAFPDRGHKIRRWIRAPEGRLSGLWFLADVRPGNVRGDRVGSSRVRRSRTAPTREWSRPRHVATTPTPNAAGHRSRLTFPRWAYETNRADPGR